MLIKIRQGENNYIYKYTEVRNHLTPQNLLKLIKRRSRKIIIIGGRGGTKNLKNQEHIWKFASSSIVLQIAEKFMCTYAKTL